MIRSSVYHLAKTPFPSKVALTIAKPAAVVLSGKISALRPFSVKPKRDEQLVDYSDAFDESDALEKGKKVSVQNKPTFAEHALGRRARSFEPFFRPFAGFDDFFARDPFAPFFSDLRFRDPFMDNTQIMPVLKNFRGGNMTLLRSSPGYEINESDSTYEIDIDIPDGMKASDLKVDLEEDGTVLHLSGELKVEEKNGVIHTRFDKHFTIGPNIDAEKLTANLSDGVLVVKAPKLQLEDWTKQSITITEKPHELTGEELRQANYSDAFDESDWIETGKEVHKEAPTN